MKNIIPSDFSGSLSKSLDSLIAMSEGASKYLQKPGVEFYGKLFTVLTCSYFMADLSSLLIEQFLPEVVESPRSGLLAQAQNQRPRLEEYDSIYDRNLFNSKGLIPGEDREETVDRSGPAVKTSLPVDLLGVVVFKNSKFSIATLQDRTDQKTYPIREGDEIPRLLRVTKVEPQRVVFVNLKNRRNEFAALPEDFESKAPVIKVGRPRRAENTGNSTQFNLNRSEVEDALGNLNKILTQARAVPNFENGVPNGYKLFQIVPGSIYEKLGLKNGDVITAVDGEPITDPGKAFDLMNDLKSSPHVEINVKRRGREETFSYDIR